MVTAKQKKIILEAVNQAKKSQFGVTAIKVELEAQLYRSDDWNDTNLCHEFFMARLAKLGLAQSSGMWYNLSHGGATQWNPRGPLKYAEFYRDGSVDSELTFTIMLDDPENIFLLPKILKIWNKFMAEVRKDSGRDADIRGAGMHMAWLNSENGEYPSNMYRSNADSTRFNNFEKSLRLLMPALYFLGASNERTRGMDYRRPGVGVETHRTSIDWRNGALEYRVFDTCYHNPDAILDNVVVMSKTLRYWNIQYLPSGLEKVKSEIHFGNSRGDMLERLYGTHDHIDMLNEGLVRLKPSYYTIRELKLQRKFAVNKRNIQQRFKLEEDKAKAAYNEYEERFKWRLEYIKHSTLGDVAYNAAFGAGPIPENPEESAELKRQVQAEAKKKKSRANYIKTKLQEFERANRGETRLTV